MSSKLPDGSDIPKKYYDTIRTHLQNEDINLALKTLRALSGEAKSRKGLDRPMVQLLASKALLEVHTKMAEMDLKAGMKPSDYVTNIYNIPGEQQDDLISISQRINRGLSKSTKR